MCSASERRLVVPSQRGTKSPVPTWWNDLPNSTQAESLAIFKKVLKMHIFYPLMLTVIRAMGTV